MSTPLSSTSRITPLAVVAALALALTACGNGSGATGAASPSSTMPGMATSASTAPLDAQFLTAMVPHHQSAMDMATVAVQRVKDPQVKALAQRIIAAQTAEIAQMTKIATSEYSTTPSRLMPPMTEQMMGMTMKMDMAADLSMLRSSPTPDTTFLEMMIPHHASALMMADEEIKRGTNAGVKALATKIKADQAKEIGEMQQMLARLA